MMFSHSGQLLENMVGMGFFCSNTCDDEPSIWGESNLGHDFILGS
jgi:hypothetical protein